MVKSRIIIAEKVTNKDRLFGSALEYYPAIVEYSDGAYAPLLFTSNDIDTARKRANANPEDCNLDDGRSFLSRIFGF